MAPRGRAFRGALVARFVEMSRRLGCPLLLPRRPLRSRPRTSRASRGGRFIRLDVWRFERIRGRFSSTMSRAGSSELTIDPHLSFCDTHRLRHRCALLPRTTRRRSLRAARRAPRAERATPTSCSRRDWIHHRLHVPAAQEHRLPRGVLLRVRSRTSSTRRERLPLLGAGAVPTPEPITPRRRDRLMCAPARAPCLGARLGRDRRVVLCSSSCLPGDAVGSQRNRDARTPS